MTARTCIWPCAGMRPGVKKLTEQDVAAHADGIIARMREARMNGRTVMFYSCIIGSIPGEPRPPSHWHGPLWAICANAWTTS